MKTQRSITNKKSASRKAAALRAWVAILLCLAIGIGLALTAVQFFNGTKDTYATADLLLTFDGAAEGKAPDGYTFDLDDLASDGLLEAALNAAGLTGTYTSDQLRTALVITGAYPKDIVAQTMNYDSLLNFTANRTLTIDQFHPTQFSVTLYNTFDEKISRADLTKLLESLLTQYQAHFAAVNVQGLPANDMLKLDLSDYDYPQQLQILQLRLNLVSDYATELYEREPAFRYAGSSFNDVVARISGLLESDIGRLKATMTLNALTKDPERLSTQYEFELQDLSNRLARRQQQLAHLDELIAAYEKSEIIYISTADSLTKIDGNSSKTYDQLVSLRRDIAQGNTMMTSQIDTYRLMLSDLNGEAEPASPEAGDGQEGTTETAAVSTADKPKTGANALSEADRSALLKAFEADVATLSGKCDAVIQDFSTMVKAWNDSKLNELTISVTDIRYYAPRVLSGAFIAAAVKTAGPIVMLAVILCLCLIVAAKTRETAVPQAADSEEDDEL